MGYDLMEYAYNWRILILHLKKVSKSPIVLFADLYLCKPFYGDKEYPLKDLRAPFVPVP